MVCVFFHDSCLLIAVIFLYLPTCLIIGVRNYTSLLISVFRDSMHICIITYKMSHVYKPQQLFLIPSKRNSDIQCPGFFINRELYIYVIIHVSTKFRYSKTISFISRWLYIYDYQIIKQQLSICEWRTLSIIVVAHPSSLEMMWCSHESLKCYFVVYWTSSDISQHLYVHIHFIIAGL